MTARVAVPAILAIGMLSALGCAGSPAPRSRGAASGASHDQGGRVTDLPRLTLPPLWLRKIDVFKRANLEDGSVGIIDGDGRRIVAGREAYRVIEGERVRSIFYQAKSGRFVFEVGSFASGELSDAATFSGPLRSIGKERDVGGDFFGIQVGSSFAIFDGEVGALVALPPEIRNPFLVTARGDTLVIRGNPAGSPCASRAKRDTAWTLHAACESPSEPTIFAKEEPNFSASFKDVVRAGPGVFVGQAYVDHRVHFFALRAEGPPIDLPSTEDLEACEAPGVAPIFQCTKADGAIAFARAEPTRVVTELEISAQLGDESPGRKRLPLVLSSADGAFAIDVSCDGKKDGRYCVRQPNGAWKSIPLPKDWRAELDAKASISEELAPGSSKLVLIPRVDGTLAGLRVSVVTQADGAYRFRLFVDGREPRETVVRGVPLESMRSLLGGAPLLLLRWLDAKRLVLEDVPTPSVDELSGKPQLRTCRTILDFSGPSRRLCEFASSIDHVSFSGMYGVTVLLKVEGGALMESRDGGFTWTPSVFDSSFSSATDIDASV